MNKFHSNICIWFKTSLARRIFKPTLLFTIMSLSIQLRLKLASNHTPVTDSKQLTWFQIKSPVSDLQFQSERLLTKQEKQRNQQSSQQIFLSNPWLVQLVPAEINKWVIQVTAIASDNARGQWAVGHSQQEKRNQRRNRWRNDGSAEIWEDIRLHGVHWVLQEGDQRIWKQIPDVSKNNGMCGALGERWTCS